MSANADGPTPLIMFWHQERSRQNNCAPLCPGKLQHSSCHYSDTSAYYNTVHYNCSMYLVPTVLCPRISAHPPGPSSPRPGTWTRLAARTIVTSHTYWFRYFGIFAFTTNEALHCQ